MSRCSPRSTSRLRFEFFFSTHAAQPATSSLSMKLYEIVWNCMKLYEIVYEKKYSWPRGVASVACPECYDQQMPAHLSKWLAWQIRVTDVVGQRVESVWISWVGLEHLLYAPTFVLTAKRKIQPIAEFLGGLTQEDVLLVTLMRPNSAGNHWKDTRQFQLHLMNATDW